MSHLAGSRQTRHSALVVLVILGILLIMSSSVSAPSPTNAQENPTPTFSRALNPSPEDILAEAQRANDSAQRTNDSVNNLINALNFVFAFIQVLGIIGGILVVGLGYSGFRTISEYRGELESAREELQKMREDLTTETKSAASVLVGFDKRISEGLDTIRNQADKAIRALALLQLGEQQMEARNMKAALQTLLEAYHYDPSNRATNYFLGEIYIQNRDMAKGIEFLERTKNEQGTYYPQAEAALAYALRVQGDNQQDPTEKNSLYAQAEMHFIQALKNDPSMRDVNGESFFGALGGLYRRQGRLADAVRCYLQAEKVTPYNGYPINNLAMLFFIQGNLKDAHHYFQRSKQIAEHGLEATPSDYWLQFNIITALVALGQEQEALEHIEAVLDVLPSPGPLDSLMDGLLTLRTSPQPPPDMTRVIARIQQASQELRARGERTM
ncbi:MAG: tetratricopeptide repeat protein [Anaerolineae bacterium]|nr:tetratricopeptide repeat protein [Anaerolineae bacterium]